MSWVSPTSYSDGINWGDPTNTYDDNESTFAFSDAWTVNPLTLNHAALTATKIRILMGYTADAGNYLKVEVHKDGSWITLYEGNTWVDGWNEYSFTQGSVDAMRIRGYLYNDIVGAVPIPVYEADFWEVAAPPAVGYGYCDGLVTVSCSMAQAGQRQPLRSSLVLPVF